jgi:hypothetical protein
VPDVIFLRQWCQGWHNVSLRRVVE